MGNKRDPSCRECEGEGWVYDYLGGCGDPECCGGPVAVQCRACDNDWSPDDDQEPPTRDGDGGRDG